MNNTYYLIRHGSTQYNLEQRFMGKADIPLNKLGIQQALELHEKIRNMDFDVAYSSNLKRAKTTAELALGRSSTKKNDDGSYKFIQRNPNKFTHKIPLVIDERLAERDFGVLTGKSRVNYTEEFPEYKGRNITKSFTDKPEGGESFGDLEKRLMPFMNLLEGKYDNFNILLFTHNGPIRVIRKICENLTEEETLKIENPYCQTIMCKKSNQI